MSKILLVEDEEIISEPLGIVLRSRPTYNVDIASNGLEALELCKQKTYDLILLDVMMPVCNGVEFMRRAQKEIDLSATKIILLTNLSNGKDVDEALKLGAGQAYVKADLNPSTLLNLVASEL
jgi:CheY-like chemotaxis protein